jgi:purine-nucleoside phosphorylase
MIKQIASFYYILLHNLYKKMPFSSKKKEKKEDLTEAIHIGALKSEIAPVVLITGDFRRAKFIAKEYLSSGYSIVNKIRGMHFYNGYHKQERITIASSGMGCPSMAIYSWELFAFYNVELIIRLGSCGAYNENLKLYDLINVKNVYTDNNFSIAPNKFSNKWVGNIEIIKIKNLKKQYHVKFLNLDYDLNLDQGFYLVNDLDNYYLNLIDLFSSNKNSLYQFDCEWWFSNETEVFDYWVNRSGKKNEDEKINFPGAFLKLTSKPIILEESYNNNNEEKSNFFQKGTAKLNYDRLNLDSDQKIKINIFNKWFNFVSDQNDYFSDFQELLLENEKKENNRWLTKEKYKLVFQYNFSSQGKEANILLLEKVTTIQADKEIHQLIESTGEKLNRDHEKNIRLFSGKIHCSDNFYYTESDRYKYFANDLDILGVEMESAALFINANHWGIKAACLLSVSDSLVSKESLLPSDRQDRFTEMFNLAFATVIEYYRKKRKDH